MFNRVNRHARMVTALVLSAGVIAGLAPASAESYEKTATTSTVSSSAVDAWWPANGVTITGVQPFKAVVDQKFVTDYKMYWQVDGGTKNLMRDSFVDWPHKESHVDVTNWKWKGKGPYEIKFTAFDHSGKELGSSIQKIYIGTSTVKTAEPVKVATEPAPAPTTTTSTSTSTPTTTTTTTATVASEPAPAPSPAPAPAPAPGPATGGLYVQPGTDISNQANAWRASRPADAAELDEMARNPIATWFGGWNSDVQGDVNRLVSAASAEGKTAVMVAYNIPQRDCGGYSSGGTSDYKSWIRSFAAGIKGRSSIVILEPDSLAQMNCLSESDKAARKALLTDATSVLKAAGARVYLDAGHSSWIAIADMAALLRGSGIDRADGFALNVSNFRTTADNNAYGRQLSSQVGGKKFVIDTSRNGNGPSADAEWCNPSGRALGERPTLSPSEPLADAYLWIKYPGQSDGSCNGGPAAGQWWGEYALGLSQRAAW